MQRVPYQQNKADDNQST